MSHLPAIPEVILLDFVPQPGEIQGIINERLPGLESPSGPQRGISDPRRRPAPAGWAEGFIFLDFLPSIGALSGVIKDHRTVAMAHRGGL